MATESAAAAPVVGPRVYRLPTHNIIRIAPRFAKNNFANNDVLIINPDRFTVGSSPSPRRLRARVTYCSAGILSGRVVITKSRVPTITLSKSSHRVVSLWRSASVYRIRMQRIAYCFFFLRRFEIFKPLLIRSKYRWNIYTLSNNAIKVQNHIYYIHSPGKGVGKCPPFGCPWQYDKELYICICIYRVVISRRRLRIRRRQVYGYVVACTPHLTVCRSTAKRIRKTTGCFGRNTKFRGC